jgi:hypothetical protein
MNRTLVKPRRGVPEIDVIPAIVPNSTQPEKTKPSTMSLLTGDHRIQRVVPWSTRVVVLFGGLAAPMGWFFFAFGMIFVWVFAAQADYTSAFLLRGKLQSAPATITAVRETGFSEGGGKRRRGTPIFACDYEFTHEGKKFSGTSYRQGRANEGTRTTAQFSPGRPEVSRLAGMRCAPFGMAVLLTGIFPIAGLAIALPGLWRGRRNVALLVHGEMAEGRLIGKEAMDAHVNKQQVFKLTFEFTDLLGTTRQAVAKTHLPERLTDDKVEKLFYSPRNPARAVLLDDLPGKPSINERGELKPKSVGAVIAVLVGPVLALLSVVMGAWIKFS